MLSDPAPEIPVARAPERQRIQGQSCSPGPRSGAELLHCSYHFPAPARAPELEPEPEPELELELEPEPWPAGRFPV
jgi:hypothetical protein